MQKRIECIIRGRVQVVTFRDFAKRNADRLRLVGAVQNMPDGSVFVVAEGDEEKLKQFIELLRKGPTFAHVRDISFSWQESKGGFEEFRIVY